MLNNDIVVDSFILLKQFSKIFFSLRLNHAVFPLSAGIFKAVQPE